MADNFTPRKPDYTVSALDKATDVKGQVGIAWIQTDGTIRIKLNPFVVLDTFKMDLVITLFKADAIPKPKSTAVVPDEPPPY